jgi:inosose dehydratase
VDELNFESEEFMEMTRRSLLAMAAGGASLRAQSTPLVFGFSLYGMKTLPWREGLGHVARIGYKSTELSLRTGWDTEPKLLTKETRSEIRKRIGDLGLVLPSVMENMFLGRPGGVDANLERLRAAAEICYEASPGPPALIETTVGGRVGTWDDIKNAMADELGAWTKRVEALQVTLALKAHSKTAMNLPERAVWLMNQVKSPRVKLVYDYSHYAANGLDLRKTMELVVPHAVFVHIKDTIGRAPDHRFVLPGDGPVDLKAYKKILIDLGYRGPVVVEVSVDVYNQPDYDPVKAAEHVWERVSPVFG